MFIRKNYYQWRRNITSLLLKSSLLENLVRLIVRMKRTNSIINHLLQYYKSFFWSLSVRSLLDNLPKIQSVNFRIHFQAYTPINMSLFVCECQLEQYIIWKIAFTWHRFEYMSALIKLHIFNTKWVIEMSLW